MKYPSIGSIKSRGILVSGDIYNGLKVVSEVGTYSNKEDAKKVAKSQNLFFKKTNQKLIAKVVSYKKKIGDRSIQIDKVVVFFNTK